MSRYVQVQLGGLADLDEVAAGLAALQLAIQRGRKRLMLEGSIECPGEPVDIRLAAGTLDAVEDFGFVADEQGVRLVCGELDRELLRTRLVEPLRTAVAERRVLQAAEAAGLEVETAVQPSGGRRIVLRRRS